MSDTDAVTAEDLRALSAAATPGPWEEMSRLLIVGGDGSWVANPDRFPDVQLIVWLRNHADALADLIDFVQEAASESRPLTAEDYEAFYACAVAGARDALDALDADA